MCRCYERQRPNLFLLLLIDKTRGKENPYILYMGVGGMRDYNLKLRDLQLTGTMSGER